LGANRQSEHLLVWNQIDQSDGNRLNVRQMAWNQSDWLGGSLLRNPLASNQSDQLGVNHQSSHPLASHRSAALDGNRHHCATQNDCHLSVTQNGHPNGCQGASQNVRQDDHRSGYQDVRHHHQS
jgi:hypothetical protein